MRRPVSPAGARSHPPPGVDRGPARRIHYFPPTGGDMSTTARPTILLADEDDVTRAFLADNLTADGYRVLIAPDRAKALALLCTGQPDLIVVDINGQTLELLDAVRCGEGIAGRYRSRRSGDRDEPLGGPAAAHPDARAWGRRLRQEAVFLSGAAGPDRRGAAPLADDQARREDRSRRTGRDRRALARGAGVRSAGRAVWDGVPAAGGARRRAASRVHARGAVARRVGL